MSDNNEKDGQPNGTFVGPWFNGVNTISPWHQPIAHIPFQTNFPPPYQFIENNVSSVKDSRISELTVPFPPISTHYNNHHQVIQPPQLQPIYISAHSNKINIKDAPDTIKFFDEMFLKNVLANDNGDIPIYDKNCERDTFGYRIHYQWNIQSGIIPGAAHGYSISCKKIVTFWQTYKEDNIIENVIFKPEGLTIIIPMSGIRTLENLMFDKKKRETTSLSSQHESNYSDNDNERPNKKRKLDDDSQLSSKSGNNNILDSLKGFVKSQKTPNKSNNNFRSNNTTTKNKQNSQVDTDSDKEEDDDIVNYSELELPKPNKNVKKYLQNTKQSGGWRYFPSIHW